MTTGIIFDIQHFCVDDGPGIRTTVFLKGCPLGCIWCHNPEGKSGNMQLSFEEEKCVRCGRCLTACKLGVHSFSGEKHRLNRKNCVGCGACVKACPAEAFRIFGRKVSVSEVLSDVLKDRAFYVNSGGGITLSGGEPLRQGEFTLELLKASKQAGLHTCMETCGFGQKEVLQEVAQFTDLFLFDIKETDKDLHKKFTGADNELIMSNLFLLDELDKEVILRCPVIPGCNEREEHFLKIADLANKLKNVREIHVEPYHPFGLDKYQKLGMEAVYQNKEFMPGERAAACINLIRMYTDVEVKIS